MTSELANIRLDEGRPFCLKCNRIVDEFEVRYGNKTVWTMLRGFEEAVVVDTGERVLIVKCHGEQFAISNQQGEVSPDYKPWR